MRLTPDRLRLAHDLNGPYPDIEQVALHTGPSFVGGDSHHSFYNGVVWSNATNGTFADTLYVYNFAASQSPINTQDANAARVLKRAILEGSQPPGYAVMAASGSPLIYRSPFDGTLPFESITTPYLDANSITEVCSEDSTAFIHLTDNRGTHIGLAKFTNVNWGAGTATWNDLDPALGFSGCGFCGNPSQVDSRVYVYHNSNIVPQVGWIHSGTDVYTQLKTYTNVTNKPLLGGQYGGGADTKIYIGSGTTNEANKIEKLDLNGNLEDSLTISGLSTTNYGQFGRMAFDYVNRHLWAQAGTTIYCIEVATMTLLQSKTLLRNANLITPIGHPSGGAFVSEQSTGSSPWDRISRVHLVRT